MTKKILIAEDEDDLRNLVKIYLEPYDLEILEAEDGEVAIQIAKEQKPDLILCDNNMPGLTGYEVLQKLKGMPETRHIPVIMVTGKKFDEEMQMLIKLDAADFIPKPYEEEKIVSAIKKVLGEIAKKEEMPQIQTEQPSTPIVQEQQIVEQPLQVQPTEVPVEVDTTSLPPEFIATSGIEQPVVQTEKPTVPPVTDMLNVTPEITSTIPEINVKEVEKPSISPQPIIEKEVSKHSGIYVIKGLSIKQIYVLLLTGEPLIEISTEASKKISLLFIIELIDVSTIAKIEKVINLFSIPIIFIGQQVFNNRKEKLLPFLTEVDTQSLSNEKLCQYLL